jgi:hypothetical protein
MASPATRGWAVLVPLACLVIASVTNACAARLYVPPAGPGESFPEAASVWNQITTRCRDASVFVAEIRVDGWVGPSRQRIPTTIQGALTRHDDIYLEVPAPVPGKPVVQMAGRAGEAVFLLPRDARVLRAPARDIVEALTGLRWGGKDLLHVLSGCVALPEAGVTGVRYGDRAALDLGRQAQAWLRLRDGSWQLDAATRDGLMIEYRARAGAFPSDIRVSSSSPEVTPLQLTFVLSQHQVNIELPADAFALAAPSTFVPMTMDDLRAMRPLGDGKGK